MLISSGSRMIRKVRSLKNQQQMLVLVILVLMVIKCEEVNGDKLKSELKAILEDYHKEYDIQLKLLVNLKANSTQDMKRFFDVIPNIDVPKMLVTQFVPPKELNPLHLTFNMNLLTIAEVNSQNLNLTLMVLEQLLWKRHYTKIILLFAGEKFELPLLFEAALEKGFTWLLVLWQNQTLTYSPFKANVVIRLAHYSHFKHMALLNNFQQKVFRVADQDYAPRGFSYYNLQGKLIRSGYYYKLVENFLLTHNGCIEHDFLDVWNVPKLNGFQGFDFIPNQLGPFEDFLESDAFLYTNYWLMAPTSKEIKQSLWLTAPFSPAIWLAILITLITLVMLLCIMPSECRDHQLRQKRDFSEALLQSLCVVLYISLTSVGGAHHYKSLFHFAICLIFLYTGFSLTNLYTCSLSSIYTTRLYEPEMQRIQDIAHTNLRILVHTGEMPRYMGIQNLPSIFHERLTARANNSELQTERIRLNMSLLYTGRGDLIQLLFFQQLYMKRPRATIISEPVVGSHMTLTLLPHSIVIEQLNRYLHNVRDSGLLQKFKWDSQWDAFMSGKIKFFHDDAMNRSLTVAYFEYAFMIWSMGLMVASIAFVWEHGVHSHCICFKFFERIWLWK
uniref:Ionotropic glutamate receptor C-terminal domain-containing protein n=1 Tax=Stomoxys calcitrans TaxID=35570 RepID=A0A1I8Q3D2_STOCA